MTWSAARTVTHIVVVAVLLVTVLAGFAGPASAHTRTQETTNLDSRITSEPTLDGVTWTIHTGGLLLEVENLGDAPIIIHGYSDEPYLRIGPDGVARNRRSPTTYLNNERFARQTRRDIVARVPAMPTDAAADAPPDWVHLDDEPRFIWHDHRTHWMSPAPPPFVDVGPITRAMMATRLVGPIGIAGEDAGVFASWEVAVTADGRLQQLTGELLWVDPPAAWPWLVLATGLVLPGLAGWRRIERDALLQPAALMVAGVALVGAIALVDDLLAWPRTPLDELTGLLHTTIFLVAGLSGSIWAFATRWGRPLALALGSGAVVYHQGLVHLPMLRASQFPTVWPDGLARLVVALGIMQAFVVAAVLLRSRVHARAAQGGFGPHGPSSSLREAQEVHG